MNLTTIERAWLSFQSDKIAETIEICQEIVSRNPEAANAFYLLAKCYRKLQDVDKSRIYYYKCIELYPDRLSFRQELSELELDHFSLGNTLAKAGNYARQSITTIKQLSNKI